MSTSRCPAGGSTVSGERKERERKGRERKGVLRRRTRSVGCFFHEFMLPGDVNEADVTAT
jgi:HSP20 family molecular chaperone IbpA